MELTPQQVMMVKDALAVAATAGIDALVIEPTAVRGTNEDRTIMIVHHHDVPVDMPFGSLGVGRVDTLLSRLNFMDACSDGTKSSVTATVETTPSKTYTRSLKIRSGRHSVDFRCANPDMIKAPKKISSEEKWVVVATPQLHSVLTRGQSMMGSDTVTIRAHQGSITAVIADVNSDKLEYALERVEAIDDDAEAIEFIHQYPIKSLQGLLKASGTGMFTITADGFLVLKINKLTVYIFPKV